MIVDGIPVGLAYDITVYQGRTFEQTFLIREADESTPVPLTGYVGHAEMRRRPGGVLLMTFEVTVDQPNGQINMQASSTATDALLRGGSYDLVLVGTEGATPIVLVIAEGKVTLVKEVTVVD